MTNWSKGPSEAFTTPIWSEVKSSGSAIGTQVAPSAPKVSMKSADSGVRMVSLAMSSTLSIGVLEVMCR